MTTPPPGDSVVLAAARVVTDAGVLAPGWVRVEEGLIAGVGEGTAPRAATGADAVDLGDATLAPGFVDLHQHGGGGAAYTDGPDAARTAIAAHRRCGTTSMVASLVADTVDRLEAQVRALAPLVETGDLLGVHLEGPWLSPAHRGAHDPARLIAPTADDVRRLLAAAPGTVRMATIAPELDGALDAVAALSAAGVLAAVGHTDATLDQGRAAVAAGARVGTHLFNAERPLHHREPGVILALLEAPEVVVELIADGVHVHPAMVRHAAASAAGGFALVTDAMAAAGAPDGAYRLGPLQVEVAGGVARVAGTDTIAGSTLTLDRAVAFAVREAGLAVDTAIRAASTTPADVLGRTDIGRLAPGARADAVVLDAALTVTRVMRAGAWV
ncbi:N-acetylglucosamine-6-phosphate deacetylase [Tersicoccus solisilvae]|uniref:N-acetylglucosamine-6-phosphate deacetylase n=1 Tax=Tersicoccus solisilvae TaxID=1882339 RepID=A0ABQ1NT58_9MICC|nr:N-acetylglucosamine-6-phosphate deacetylase [Tersicoccus solisilvae]GGC82133.1 N-acetylglucosamine-6-phosphate deacetylase [Tersicoccus solisilvae]